MYQSQLLYHFESNAKENFTTLEVRVRSTGMWIMRARIPRYHTPAWMEMHKAEAVDDIVNSADSEVVTNEEFFAMLRPAD